MVFLSVVMVWLARDRGTVRDWHQEGFSCTKETGPMTSVSLSLDPMGERKPTHVGGPERWGGPLRNNQDSNAVLAPKTVLLVPH